MVTGTTMQYRTMRVRSLPRSSQFRCTALHKSVLKNPRWSNFLSLHHHLPHYHIAALAGRTLGIHMITYLLLPCFQNAVRNAIRRGVLTERATRTSLSKWNCKVLLSSATALRVSRIMTRLLSRSKVTLSLFDGSHVTAK